MRRYIGIILLAVSVTVLVYFLFIRNASWEYSHRPLDLSNDIPLVDSTSLNRTIITAHLKEPIPQGKNVLYCASFQFAWNVLCDDVIGEEVRLTEEPAWVPTLNERLVTEDAISEDTYVAMAGFGKDGILNDINTALKQKFGNDAPVVQENLMPETIFAYAYLMKDLSFKTPFESLDEPLYFQNRPVAAFGIKEAHRVTQKQQKRAEQVKVLYNDFETESCIIQLETKSVGNELILAKITPKATLLDTLNEVIALTGNSAPHSFPSATLCIPKFNFNLRHAYTVLHEKYLLNPGFTTYFIEKTEQDIRFRMDEKGVMLRSQARMIANSSMSAHHFIFNRPFLVIMRKQGAERPYFALWVDNPELLVGFKVH